eukprot:214661-Rhodomonas_salina.1
MACACGTLVVSTFRAALDASVCSTPDAASLARSPRSISLSDSTPALAMVATCWRVERECSVCALEGESVARSSVRAPCPRKESLSSFVSACWRYGSRSACTPTPSLSTSGKCTPLLAVLVSRTPCPQTISSRHSVVSRVRRHAAHHALTSTPAAPRATAVRRHALRHMRLPLISAPSRCRSELCCSRSAAHSLPARSTRSTRPSSLPSASRSTTRQTECEREEASWTPVAAAARPVCALARVVCRAVASAVWTSTAPFRCMQPSPSSSKETCAPSPSRSRILVPATSTHITLTVVLVDRLAKSAVAVRSARPLVVYVLPLPV